MTIDKRSRGWLDDQMHATLRELLLHTCARYQLVCPAYCLMPDHAHFLWMGVSVESHQLNALKFFRRVWNHELKKRDVELQRQAYDHVLLETERNPEAFEDTVLYIFKNPQRGKLIENYAEWPFSGAIALDYPALPFYPVNEFWSKFWKIHNRLVQDSELQ